MKLILDMDTVLQKSLAAYNAPVDERNSGVSGGYAGGVWW